MNLPLQSAKRRTICALILFGMVAAFNFAINQSNPFTLHNIRQIGARVKSVNSRGFRRTSITTETGNQGLHYSLIERTLSNLLGIVDVLTPDEFYTEFGNIHPFEDGNGRVGAILWNILRGSTFEPICPPDFSNHENVK